MTISLDTHTGLSINNSTVQKARGLNRTVNAEGMTLEPEKTEEEIRLESSTLSVPKDLTPEEEKRVLFLENLMAQLLAMADGQPTDEQKARIKDMERELEKITGIKVHSSISNTTDKMIGKKDNDKEEKEKQQYQLKGIDPKEVKHNKEADLNGKELSPAMRALYNNSLSSKFENLLTSSTQVMTSISS